MRDYTTKQIGEAREKSLSPATKEIQGWLFSPQFLAILGIAKIAGAICIALKERSLPKAPNEGRTEVYWDVSIFIAFLGARIAVDYNVRRKNQSIVQRAWMIWWDKRMGKRSAIERFFGIAKRWFGLSQFHGKGLDSFLLHTLLTYCSMLSVALVAVRIGRPDLKLSPKQLLAPC